MILQQTPKDPTSRWSTLNSSQDACLKEGVILRFIHFLYLSAFYLIFSTYLILSIGSMTPQSYDIMTQSPSFTLCMSLLLYDTVHLLLEPSLQYISTVAQVVYSLALS